MTPDQAPEHDTPARDAAIRALAEGGERYLAAVRARDAAMEALRPLVRAAAGQGVGPSLLAELAHVTRPTVYAMLREEQTP